MSLSHAPCLRSRVAPGPLLEEVLRDAGILHKLAPHLGPLALPAEAYCAAHTAALYRAALALAEDLKAEGNALLFLGHHELPNAVIRRLLPHFGIQLSRAQRHRVLQTAQVHSKNPSLAVSDDSANKRALASPATIYWAEQLVAEPHRAALAGSCSQQSSGEDEKVCSAGAILSGNEVEEEQAVAAGELPGRLLFTGGVRADARAVVCPETFAEAGHDGFAKMSALAATKFAAGEMLIADACWRYALTFGGSRSQRLNVLDNLACLEDTLGEQLFGVGDSCSLANGNRVETRPTHKHKMHPPNNPLLERVISARVWHARTNSVLLDAMLQVPPSQAGMRASAKLQRSHRQVVLT